METQTPQPHREKPAVGSPQPICDPMNPILGDEALALAEAEWAGVHSLTEAEQSCVRLLEVVRDYDWRTNVQPESSTQTPSVSTQYSALILHRRGEVATAPCTSCHDGKTGAFQSCVICPSFGNRSLWRGACTNCIYSGESATCSLRTSLDWDPAFNECLFAQYSGLRQAITDPDNTTLALLIGTAYGSGGRMSVTGTPGPPSLNAVIPGGSNFVEIGSTRYLVLNGQEIRLPIPVAVWEDPVLLRQAVADLVFFESIVRAHLHQNGIPTERDHDFWLWVAQSVGINPPSAPPRPSSHL